MRILLIEDDKKISSYLSQGLQESGFVVDQAFDGEEGLNFVSTYQYNLIILDLMLPKKDGLTVIDELRKQGHVMPVLILSAKRSVEDRVSGLQSGGDDYLTKPFSFSELLARVKALLRRSTGQTNVQTANSLHAGDIHLDLISRKVTRSGNQIELQGKEFSLLEYFMRHPEIVLSKTQLLEGVWNNQFDPQTNVVDVLVFRLRNKIDRDFDAKTIQTIRGVGYLFQPNKL